MQCALCACLLALLPCVVTITVGIQRKKQAFGARRRTVAPLAAAHTRRRRACGRSTHLLVRGVKGYSRGCHACPQAVSAHHDG